ncbi:MAG: peptidyl-prolyl cis-trans isomerase [Frankiaceae bacterium]|nr:peptidyl-prolyl cis-trans isomerase [Frankiaceae bacterium]
MSRRHLALVGVVAAIGLSGCSGSSGSDRVTSQPGPTQSQTAGALSCQPPTSSAPAPQQFKSEPPLTIGPATYTATIVTNCGTIVVALDGKQAPHTVNSFAFLAGHHFFDHSPCHRLTTSGIFVLQCGDPTGTGRGGPGYTIPDENLKGAAYPAGTVAMANTGQPHSGGSQFFIVYADTALPPAYTPFGRVVEGLDLVRAVAAKGADNSNGPGDGAPVQPVVIESFTVAKGG